MNAARPASPAEIFREILAEESIDAALRFLNARATHRFTAVYRFDGSTLHNLYLYDRANPEFGLFPDARLEESYCSIVRETTAAFVVEDSAHDARVGEHPKRELILSYCGIPLRRADGALFGTLCHFDFAPHEIARGEIEFLEEVAPYILNKLEQTERA